MKTTTRLYDVIYLTYNNLFGDFFKDGQIAYFSPELQFTHKVAKYDSEIQTVCRNTIFYGLDNLTPTARLAFEKEFLGRFLTRVIKFQTYEVLNWRLVSFISGISDLVNDYYNNASKYLQGASTSTSHSEDNSTSSSTSRTNNIDVDLPQNNTDMSLDKDTFDYASDMNHSKSKSDDTSSGASNSTNTSSNFDADRLSKLKAFHDELFQDLDRQLFSQML